MLTMNLSSCAYKIGQKFRSLPGGYQKLSIPVIKNKSMEPGAEAILTQALKEEFFRSTILKVVSDDQAEVRLEGQIDSLTYDTSPAETIVPGTSNSLATGTVLAKSYTMVLYMTVKLVKIGTSEVLWQSQFSGARNTRASLVTIAGVNSVNPIYNHDAKRSVLKIYAYELSNQIYNNMTENF